MLSIPKKHWVLGIALTVLLFGKQMGFASDWLNWPFKPRPSNQTTQQDLISPNGIASPISQSIHYFSSVGLLKNEEIPVRPIQRSEWAALLSGAISEMPTFLSEANFYTDVPVNYWAYGAIEQLRLKNVIPFDEIYALGGFLPDKPIDRLTALLWLSRLLPTVSDSLLQSHQSYLLPFYGVDAAMISSEANLKSILTIMETGFVQDVLDSQNHLLPLNEPLTTTEAMQLAYRLKQFKLQQSFSTEVAEKRVPAGLLIKIAPSTVVFWPQIQVGQPFYFVLPEPIAATLTSPAYPEKSRVVGLISEASQDKEGNAKEAIILLRQLILPNGQRLKIGGRIQLFPISGRQVLLPEDIFSLTTE